LHGSVLGFFAYGALQGREVAGKDVLEVGSLDVNGSVRPFVEARQPARYVGVDLEDGPGVDQVCDAVALVDRFGLNTFDVVISTEMLEHAEDWQRSVLAMVDVLRPGGVLVVTTRSPGFAWHHPPDRWRYTQQAMADILDALGLEPIVLMDDPEHPGVFCKARKPVGWIYPGAGRLDPVTGITAMHEPLKILGLPGNPDGCGYHRMWSPLTKLQRHSGHQVVIPPPGQQNVQVDEDEAGEFDIVVRQRPAYVTREWRRWKDHALLVAELDDDIFNPDPSGLPHWLDEGIRQAVRENVELADLVTVSTPYLAERMADHNPNVVVLPNHVNRRLLDLERPQRDQVTLCWEGGSSHLQDVVMLQQPLKELRRRHAFDLHLLGMDYLCLFGFGRYTPWQRNVWDFYQALDGDIGLAPLEATPFNRSRSDIKALQYAALGIPVVASDLEPYREFVVDGVTGFLVKTEEQWTARLSDLINDPAMRAEMGAKARELAYGRTIQQGWRLWADAYERLAGWPANTREREGDPA
jgi:glycosyltransferase involved in cell wall biosynthesis